MGKTSLRLAIAGTAVAAATSAVLPAQSALAATPAPDTTRESVVAAPYAVGAAMSITPASNRIAASGTIRDNTSGNDFVAVQTFIQRLDARGWVTVVTGARRTGVNTATSSIGWRSCTNGRVYRVKVNWNWNNTARSSLYTAARTC
ncbi:hypothetical protein ACFVH6_08120 [Spirillospora sp. NPDC127200]